MKRILWLGLGAVGGIVVYRKGGRWLEQARTQGVLVTAQQVAASGRTAVAGAQRLVSAATVRDTGETR